MNRKILLSVGVMVFVAALVISATGAFFTDKETSAGNIFTAGSIDLKVDHTRQTYNGVDCKTCSVNIYSSKETVVTGGTGDYVGGYPAYALELTTIHPNWISSIPSSPAKWIWVTNPVLEGDTTNGAQYTFEKKFYWNGSISGISLDLALAADNGYKIVFNGTPVADQLGTEHNYGALVDTTLAEAAMLPLVVSNGVNTLEITVKNKPGSSNPAHNPAGLLFDLKIERPQEECKGDPMFQKMCMLWGESDLTGQKFWNFNDVKPGDWGSNLISLHVYDNDAHVCLLTHDIEGTPENPNLPNYIKTAAWMSDVDGTKGDPLALSPLQDSNVQLKVKATTTEYVLVEWCFGNWVDDKCDGEGNYNDAQGESVSLSMTAYAIQQRHNENFVCSTDLLKPEQPEDKDE